MVNNGKYMWTKPVTTLVLPAAVTSLHARGDPKNNSTCHFGKQSMQHDVTVCKSPRKVHKLPHYCLLGTTMAHV